MRNEMQISDSVKRLSEMTKARATPGGGEGEREVVDQSQNSGANNPGSAKLMSERSPESPAFGMQDVLGFSSPE